jgi:hypothetical protein
MPWTSISTCGSGPCSPGVPYLAIVAELALRLGLLAPQILLAALLLEGLGADQAADELLARSDRLVPCALDAVGVFLGHAGARDGEWADVGGGIGWVPFFLGLILLGFARGLDGAQSQ